MNVRKSLAALAAYAALAVNQSFAAEEAKPKDEFGISVNVVYSQRFIPELSDDWRVDCFRATDEQTGAQRLAFSYVQGAVPDFPVRFGWPSDALQVQSVTRVQDLVRQLENSEFSKADFIAQAKFLSAAEKRFFLSNMGSIGGAMYG
ncbi:MAG TPA: hypothetical protein VJJ82_05710, partial [Candidatus Nanoarchaeia archaeon]|nr:hypothetical protein [Candidatus Nanoarchaeia archaeon]